MFGFSHIDFEWLSDAVQTAILALAWAVMVLGFTLGLVGLWRALRLALGAL
jgi:uncharacterized membrane protein YiaA